MPPDAPAVTPSVTAAGVTDRVPAVVPAAVAERLRAVRGFVFDLDGTLVLGDRRNHGLKPLPGALAITRWLRERRVPFALLTNGTTRTPAHYARMLREIGFVVADDGVVTPASSAATVFARRGYRRVLALGNEGLAGPLRDVGLEIVPPGAGGVDAVLVGWYPEFTMAILESACQAVWHGAALYSASQSPFFATEDGRAIGTSRAISAMIRSLTGCRVHVVGKPSLHALRKARSVLGVPLKDVAVVRDDPELEVPMALRGGSLAIAVHTGIGGEGSYSHLPAGRGPHLAVHGVGELLAICEQLTRA